MLDRIELLYLINIYRCIINAKK